MFRHRWALFFFAVIPFSSAQVGRVLPSSGPQGRLPYSDPLLEAPYPYDLTYSFQTDDGATSHAQEVGDQFNTKRGSYGYTGPDGIYRQVDYVADENGFRATIRTNEPGMSRYGQAGASIILNPQGEGAPVQGVPARPVAVPVRPVAAARPIAPFPVPAVLPVAAVRGSVPVAAAPVPVHGPAVFPLPAARAPIPIAARQVYPRPLVAAGPVSIVGSPTEIKPTIAKKPKYYNPKPYF